MQLPLKENGGDNYQCIPKELVLLMKKFLLGSKINICLWYNRPITEAYLLSSQGLHCCFIYSCPTVKINFTKYMWYPVNSGEAYFSLDRWLVSETPGSCQGHKIIITVDTWSQKQVPLRLKTFSSRMCRAPALLLFQLSCKLTTILFAFETITFHMTGLYL